MPLIISDNVRVTYPLESGEKVVFVFPPYSDPELQRGIRQLLNNRFRQRGRKVENRQAQEREKFFDQFCIDCENIEDDHGHKITERDNWKRMIPPNIKSSVVGTEFEEKEMLSDEEREDLGGASDEDTD